MHESNRTANKTEERFYGEYPDVTPDTLYAIEHIDAQIVELSKMHDALGADESALARMTELLRDIELEAASLAFFTKYAVGITGEYSINFTVPRGSSFMDLYNDANEYALRTGPYPAIYNESLKWISDSRGDAVHAPFERPGEQSVEFHPALTSRTQHAQEEELNKVGQTLTPLEAAVAAHALFYCATKADMFRIFRARCALPEIALERSMYGVFTVHRIGDPDDCGHLGALGSHLGRR